MTDDQLRFIERCWRFIKLEQMKAPEQVLGMAKKLIKESVQELSGDEIAHAIMEFPSTVAKLKRIEDQVEAEHPIIPFKKKSSRNKTPRKAYPPSYLRVISALKKAPSIRRLWHRSCVICKHDIKPDELCKSDGHGNWGHAVCVYQFVLPN